MLQLIYPTYTYSWITCNINRAGKYLRQNSKLVPNLKQALNSNEFDSLLECHYAEVYNVFGLAVLKLEVVEEGCHKKKFLGCKS